MPLRWLVWSAALVVGIAGGIGLGAATSASQTTPAQDMPSGRQSANPNLDLGTKLNTVAPGFTLTDQFGKTVSLAALRGKVVVLSFNDPLCTTICPLTTTALLEAKQLLGPAAADVELVGVGANPEATQVKWVRDYSEAHGMLHKWRFLTAPLAKMERVWSAYGIRAAVDHGAIDHTPATFIIDPQGRETRLFFTAMSYSSVHQLAQVMAHGIAAALPGHPRVADTVSLDAIPLVSPRQHVTLRNATSGKVRLGPGHGPQLVLFFDTWESEVSNLTADLEGLNRYAALNSVAPLVAIDEADVEPKPTSLPLFLYNLPHPLAYPVAIDTDGRVADGYGVQDSPWLTLVSGSGKILWSYDVGADGWLSTQALVSRVHAVLAHAQG